MKNTIRTTVSQWPGVHVGKKFGLPALLVNRRAFLVLLEDGIVLTNVTPRNREKAIRDYDARTFVHRKKARDGWLHIPVRTTDEYRVIEGLIQASYQTTHMMG
jgi:hypothetical protein